MAGDHDALSRRASPACWSCCHRGRAGVLPHALAPRATRRRCCWATRPPPPTSRACRRSTASTSRCRCSSAYWLSELLHGNLGQSIFLQRPVTQALRERAEPTLFLTLLAIAIAALIGCPAASSRRCGAGARSTRSFTGFAMLGASIPSFWFGLVLMQIFAVRARLVPGLGLRRARRAAARAAVHALVLPATVLGVLNSALIIRFTRASMLDVLGEDYVRTARAKGLSESARGAAPRAAQRAGADRHRARPDGRAADRRRDRHRDGVRPARRRQPGGLRGAAARLPGDPGRAAGDRGDLRAHQPRRSTCSTRSSIRA